MSTANSSVSVCSNALLMLGAQTINNFTENNDRARLAANLYPGARDALLREHPWSCAVKRVVLSADKDKPEYGFSYRFTLPADYIRVLSVGEANEDVEYLVEQRCILANRSSLKLRYVFKIRMFLLMTRCWLICWSFLWRRRWRMRLRSRLQWRNIVIRSFKRR